MFLNGYDNQTMIAKYIQNTRSSATYVWVCNQSYGKLYLNWEFPLTL